MGQDQSTSRRHASTHRSFAVRNPEGRQRRSSTAGGWSVTDRNAADFSRQWGMGLSAQHITNATMSHKRTASVRRMRRRSGSGSTGSASNSGHFRHASPNPTGGLIPTRGLGYDPNEIPPDAIGTADCMHLPFSDCKCDLSTDTKLELGRRRFSLLLSQHEQQQQQQQQQQLQQQLQKPKQLQQDAVERKSSGGSQKFLAPIVEKSSDGNDNVATAKTNQRSQSMRWRNTSAPPSTNRSLTTVNAFKQPTTVNAYGQFSTTMDTVDVSQNSAVTAAPPPPRIDIIGSPTAQPEHQPQPGYGMVSAAPVDTNVAVTLTNSVAAPSPGWRAASSRRRAFGHAQHVTVDLLEDGY